MIIEGLIIHDDNRRPNNTVRVGLIIQDNNGAP